MKKMPEASKPAANKKGVALVQTGDESKDAVIAKAALSPYLSGAVVADAYQANIMGPDVDLMEMVNVLTENAQQTQGGDLSHLEAMLLSQATGLQTIFTSLAKRAQVQTSQRNLEAFLGLAMKAQSQSRATIATLVDLKFPRQVAFVKQTNVSHGPQQVNNHLEPGAGSRTEEMQSQQTKLYVGHNDGGAQMDTRATTAAGGSHPALHAMAVLHGPDKRRRQG
jgi:hypothetical protein